MVQTFCNQNESHTCLNCNLKKCFFFSLWRQPLKVLFWQVSMGFRVSCRANVQRRGGARAPSSSFWTSWQSWTVITSWGTVVWASERAGSPQAWWPGDITGGLSTSNIQETHIWWRTLTEFCNKRLWCCSSQTDSWHRPLGGHCCCSAQSCRVKPPE